MDRVSNHTAPRPFNSVPCAWALVAVALSAAVYHRILGIYFHSDDFMHLFYLTNYDLLTNLLMPYGGHVYVVRNAVFFVCKQLFGMDPTAYYAVALATHLVAVVLLFTVVWRLTGRALLSCFAAALWGTCPLQAGVLGWYTAFGHALAALVLLIILVQIAGAVRGARAPTRGQLITWYALAVTGVTCFGVGIGFALALPWVILLVFPGRYRWWRPPLWTLLVVIPSVYVGVTLAYELRADTNVHMLSGARSIFALTATDLPAAAVRLANYGIARLVLGVWCVGDWVNAVTIPVATAIAVATAIGLLAVAAYDRGAGRQILAGLLLALSAYTTVAAGRGFLFMVAPQTLHVSSRYHYAALAPLVIALAIALASAGRSLHISANVARTAFAVWAAITVLGVLRGSSWLDMADRDRGEAHRFVELVRSAAASTASGQPVYLRNRFFTPFPLPGTEFPRWAGAFTLFFQGDSIDGRRIYFVEADPQVRERFKGGVPIGRLMIDPADLPRDAHVH